MIGVLCEDKIVCVCVCECECVCVCFLCVCVCVCVCVVCVCVRGDRRRERGDWCVLCEHKGNKECAHLLCLSGRSNRATRSYVARSWTVFCSNVMGSRMDTSCWAAMAIACFGASTFHNIGWNNTKVTVARPAKGWFCFGFDFETHHGKRTFFEKISFCYNLCYNQVSVYHHHHLAPFSNSKLGRCSWCCHKWCVHICCVKVFVLLVACRA
jgi:hypothetical protein